MKPYRSADVGHVRPPDPANYWEFEAGQTCVIGVQPYLAFRVDSVGCAAIGGTQTLGAQVVSGELHLDMPVVIARDAQGEPQVTLTLRRIDNGRAFIQVSANPKLRQGRR